MLTDYVIYIDLFEEGVSVLKLVVNGPILRGSVLGGVDERISRWGLRDRSVAFQCRAYPFGERDMLIDACLSEVFECPVLEINVAPA